MSPSAKTQPMSISRLCQQDDSNVHTVKQELDQDPLDLYSDDDDDHFNLPYMNNNRGTYSDYDQHHDLDGDYNDGAASPGPAEQLAAEALGDMVNANLEVSDSSSFMAQAPFISRMSSLPIVNSALKAYESGKQSSKVMKVRNFCTVLFVSLKRI